MLRVVSDLPSRGPGSADTQAIVNAEKLRLEELGGAACHGKYGIDLQSWDDSSAGQGKWDSKVEAANAAKAVADASIIAWLGPYNSGAARISIPILNPAHLVMISPANSYPGLTRSITGNGEPGIFYPNGVRNYARVSSSDDVQAEFAAHYMLDVLKVNSVYVLDDGEPYGQLLSRAFIAQASRLGLLVSGSATYNPLSYSFVPLMKEIATSHNGKAPEAIYAAMVLWDNNFDGQLIRDKVAGLGDNTQVKFMGADAIEDKYFADTGGRAAEGVYATLAGLPLPDYPAAGQKFIQDYSARYGSPPTWYAPYGYEAMGVLLKALQDVCDAGGDPTDRETVRAAVFNIRDFQGVLGTWSFDANGDTSQTQMTVYQVQQGAFVEVGAFP
jgi:branched-chain amino acid transport system substrate-binding protein